MQSPNTLMLDAKAATAYLTEIKTKFPSINSILLLDKFGKVSSSSEPAVDSLVVATLANTIWRCYQSQVQVEFNQEELQRQFIFLDNKTVFSYKLDSYLLCLEFGKDVEVGVMNCIGSKIVAQWSYL